MITVAGWAVHAMIYPWFVVYLWTIEPGARAFHEYIETVDMLEHARV